MMGAAAYENKALALGYTVGQAAALLGVGIHRVKYLLETGALSPSGRLGRLRILSPGDVEKARALLRPATALLQPAPEVPQP